MTNAKSGDWMDTGPYLSGMDFTKFRMRVSTERYYSSEFKERERERLWMRVWQIAGREDDIPEHGDWMEYRLFDQSWIIVRGKDGTVRGFVNACRHRGNRLCTGKGHAVRFNCRYHNWAYGLEGQLVGVAKPDFEGSLDEFLGADKSELGLVEIQVECFAGFIFLNPDPGAVPLSEFLGEAAEALAPYHIEEMIPTGINVRERVDCNWKVIMDAFGEGYHTQGVHPELVNMVDLNKERFYGMGGHCAATVPFGPPGLEKLGAEGAIDAFMKIPTSHFPGMKEVLPRFSRMVNANRGSDGSLALPGDVTPRSLLQQAVRETFVAKGLDVKGLTDSQMMDYQFWLFFPNVFIQVCAGEATIIIAEPDANGDPNRCCWRVMTLVWLPPEQRAEMRTGLREIPEGEHFEYFLALEQDYQQMAVQQKGLCNRGLKELVLTRQEPRVAHFHKVLDSWLE